MEWKFTPAGLSPSVRLSADVFQDSAPLSVYLVTMLLRIQPPSLLIASATEYVSLPFIRFLRELLTAQQNLKVGGHN